MLGHLTPIDFPLADRSRLSLSLSTLPYPSLLNPYLTLPHNQSPGTPSPLAIFSRSTFLRIVGSSPCALKFSCPTPVPPLFPCCEITVLVSNICARNSCAQHPHLLILHLILCLSFSCSRSVLIVITPNTRTRCSCTQHLCSAFTLAGPTPVDLVFTILV